MVFTPKTETLDADFPEITNFMNRSILASNPTAVGEKIFPTENSETQTT